MLSQVLLSGALIFLLLINLLVTRLLSIRLNQLRLKRTTDAFTAVVGAVLRTAVELRCYCVRASTDLTRSLRIGVCHLAVHILTAVRSRTCGRSDRKERIEHFDLMMWVQMLSRVVALIHSCWVHYEKLLLLVLNDLRRWQILTIQIIIGRLSGSVNHIE